MNSPLPLVGRDCSRACEIQYDCISSWLALDGMALHLPFLLLMSKQWTQRPFGSEGDAVAFVRRMHGTNSGSEFKAARKGSRN